VLGRLSPLGSMVLLLALAVPLTTARPARGDTGTAATGHSSSYLARGLAELGVGLLSLPGATLCVDSTGDCVKGDSSLLLEGWTLVRPMPYLALGAGLGLGTNTTDSHLARSSGGVPRLHGHGYFTAEAAGRWYSQPWGPFEPWLGGTAGLIVVNDSFSSTAETPTSSAAFVGPRASTLSTEGLSLGLGAGVAYRLSARWSLATSMRGSMWVLPTRPARNAMGDESSLRGVNYAYMLVGALCYEVAL
jgi:hypothetical protein